ncbi:anti-sigma factor [Thioalkalivibrio sp.]|uniref:anti-sigma factor n=1 Tax=Thioalkalivibrio sp. TaxID=2093813 RepID=UPI003562D545
MSEGRPSEEILNAFVDGEFSPEDRLSALQSISANESLSREVCDFYQLKELVNMAYRPDVLPTSAVRRPPRTGSPRSWLPALVAAIGALALVLIAVIGFTRDGAHEPVPMVGNGDPGVAASAAVAAGRPDVDQVLFHVTETDRLEAAALFDDIEHMLQTAWLDGEELEVQLVVHGTALELVRTDLAPFPNRIRDLVYNYPNLRVTACGQSRARREREEDRLIEFLPWVEEVESGVREAAQRQAEGWTYIRL